MDGYLIFSLIIGVKNPSLTSKDLHAAIVGMPEV
jgi:hypothetical protein